MHSESRTELEESGVVEGFRCLGDPTRLAIAARLAGAGPEGMCVTDIAESLEMDPPRVSFHLTRLKFAGLALPERKGQEVIYRLVPAKVRELGQFLVLDSSWK